MTDNIDDVIKALSKLEKEATTEVVKESRKAVRASMRSFMPAFKGVTPVDTGTLKRSVKLKSRTRRGVTKISMIWQNKYAGYVNFKRKNKGSQNPNERKITNMYQHLKARMERDITLSLRNVYRRELSKRGFNVT